MSLMLTPADIQLLLTIPVCQPHQGNGAQFVLIPAQYGRFFEPLLHVPINGTCHHGAKLEPMDSQGLRQRVLEVARAYIGQPFDALADPSNAPTTFSCSTFTTFVFGHVGIVLDRYAATQRHQGLEIPIANVKPGDLLFYGGQYAVTDADGISIAHVAIASDGEKRIHGSSTNGRVVERRFRARKVVAVTDPYPPEGDYLLVTLPRMIHDMRTAMALVRYWQKKNVGR